MTPEVIRTLQGAVRQEKDEWLVVLLGDKSKDGFTFTVDGLYTPPKQTRTGATCEIDEEKFPFPAEVTARKIGSLHSHHQMGAFPSGVDLGEKGLFYTYTMSIVISNQIKGLEDQILGFSYYGECRVKIGCGAYAKLPIVIVPVGFEEDWPIAASDPVWPPNQVENEIATTLGDCKRFKEVDGSNRYYRRRQGRCGFIEEKETLRHNLFGQPDGSSIISVLPKAIPPQPSASYSGGVTRYNGAEYSSRTFQEGTEEHRAWWRERGYTDEEYEAIFAEDEELNKRTYEDHCKTQEVPVVNHSALVKIAR